MKPYESYKAANIPWLEEVPSHWEFQRNKNVMTERKDVVGSESMKFTLLSLTLNGVIKRDIESGKGKFPKEFDSYKIVNDGEIVFCLFDMDETPRTVGLSNFDGMITGAYDVFAISEINTQYLFYYYLSLDMVKAMKPLYTGLRKVISVPKLLGTKLPAPPRAEQDQIVRYLDWQISKINKLVQAKKQQIELLKEQKQAVINQAVTKGLDPNVKMKDSGVEWLGEVPLGWHVRPFYKIANVKSNLVHPDAFQDFKQVSPANIEKDTGKLLSCGTVREAGIVSDNHLFYKGQILYSKIRPLLNKVSIAPFDGLCSADMYPIETTLETEYLVFYMLSKTFLSQISMSGNRVKMPKINKEELATVLIVFPDTEKQGAIIDYLKDVTEKTDAIIADIENELVLLYEYKTSLISSVVTGKIDVRGVVVPEFGVVKESTDDANEI